LVSYQAEFDILTILQYRSYIPQDYIEMSLVGNFWSREDFEVGFLVPHRGYSSETYDDLEAENFESTLRYEADIS